MASAHDLLVTLASKDRLAFLATVNARLTQAQFEEVSSAISDIISSAVQKYRDQQGDDVRPYLIRLDMFPIDSRALGATDGEME